MSERTNAPRPGGRATDQRGSVPARDADARSDARGARHFTEGKSDTRRSGMRKTTRGDSAETSLPRARVRDSDEDVRGAGRTASAGVDRLKTGVDRLKTGADRTKNGADRTKADAGRPKTGADLVRGKGRRPEPMIGKSREKDRAREAGRDRKPSRDLGRESLADRRRDVRAGGRRPVTDAPVDGTAALQIEVSPAEPIELTLPAEQPLELSEPAKESAKEPVRTTGAPRLRVAPPAPISAPRAPFVASVIGVVIVGVLGILLINTKTNENSFRIADLQKQDAALDNQQQDLDNQLVQISSIGNLDAAARRLGLVKAENPALFTLPDGKIIGVLTPANGRPAVTAQDAATGPDATASAGTSDAGAGKVVPAGGQADGLVQDGTNGAATTAGTGTAATGTTGTGTGTDSTGTNGTGTTTGNGSQMNGTTGTGTGR